MTQDHLLLALITIFVVIGVMLPYAQDSVGNTKSEYNIDGISNDVNSGSLNPVTIGSVLLSVVKMFFFTFGDLPLWLDIILFLPLRIVAWGIIIDKIPFT